MNAEQMMKFAFIRCLGRNVNVGTSAFKIIKLLEFQVLSGQNSRLVALKVSFAHPGWSNQQETGRLITLRFGTIWGLLGPFGAIWDHMGPFGVIWDKNDQNDLF